MIGSNEIKERVERFTIKLVNGEWDEQSYVEIEKFILEDSKNSPYDISLDVAYSCYLLGSTISHLLSCYQNPNDVYKVENLSEDDFHARYSTNINLMNVRFGKLRYVDYKSLSF